MQQARSTKVSAVVVLGGLTWATSLLAASPASPADQAFVAKVSQGGLYEVEAGKVAAGRGTTPVVKDFGLLESQDHEGVNSMLKHVAGMTEDIGGTAVGGIHRSWGDLKAHLGGGDHTLLDTAEQGEDAAKKAFKEALEDQDIHSSVREVLVRQQSHIAASHDKVKALRDSHRIVSKG